MNPLQQLLNAQKNQDLLVYKPEFYTLSNKEDIGKLSNFLSQTHDVQVIDEFRSQLRELVKLREPAKKLSEAEIQQKINDFLDEKPEYEAGVWVYYPWSKKLLHILAEAEFAEVRTNRNRNKITSEEQQILSKQIIGIVGLSVGQSIALTMALERSFGEIRLADFDTIELSNLNRIRTGIQNLGISKAVCAAREIAEIDPYLKVTSFTEGLTEENMEDFMLKGGKLSILVDECDGLEMKIQSRLKAKQLQIPVVMDTSDRGMVDVERFDLEPERPILHGLIAHLDLSNIKNLTPEQKIPFLLAIAGFETLSARAKASLAEMGKTISTWPQLASSVVMGGGVAADVCRRIALDEFRASGRYYVDLEQIFR